ncbi:MAG TPA: nuclear transport factor 2 family protein [Thermoanaerobaculia bacterium]|nr:nuclear transport factor 2 family protein [Thermoanaerobaculia bacterium]
MDDALQHLVEKDAIIDTITRLFIATDERDWEAARACFTPRVLFDMSSMTGEAAAELDSQEIVDGWDRGLRHLAAVHHQAGNFKVTVDGGQADAFCYGIASHYLPNATGRNTRFFVGSYDFYLEKDSHLEKDGAAWRIRQFRFNLKYMDGNLQLEGEVDDSSPS